MRYQTASTRDDIEVGLEALRARPMFQAMGELLEWLIATEQVETPQEALLLLKDPMRFACCFLYKELHQHADVWLQDDIVRDCGNRVLFEEFVAARRVIDGIVGECD